jgi:hypothetical protein
MKIFGMTLGESNQFSNMTLPVHWDAEKLYDDMYVVGAVTRTLMHDQLCWCADPYWNEQMHFFDTEDEAKAWLVAMYKMGGANEPKAKRRVRPAAK